MQVTFTTVIEQMEGINATGLPVPADAVARLGMKQRPPVKVSLGDYTYRSTVAAYGDVFLLPLAAEHRAAAGVKPGDRVEVTLEPDLESRPAEVPDDLAAALAAQPGARERFDSLAYSLRREYILQVEFAKGEEIRLQRIARIVTFLSAG